jgi:peptidoglycan/LPS O-acetylase OafA/YrhL
MQTDHSRMPLIDTLKAISCLLIASHHLALYGPMPDFAYPLIPDLIDWLRENGQIAVQVFFIIAGFLSARKLAPYGIPLVTDPMHVIKQRYIRLVIPYLAALTLAIGCAALARAWMTHDFIPNTPNFFQLLAHIFLLHDLLNQEALSAGVWFVAIDFQLFVLVVTALWLSSQIEYRFPRLKLIHLILIAGLTVVSLFVFNRNSYWDETAFYFFGSYGLGILVYWASHKQYHLFWFTLLGILVIAALLVDFRSRIAVAGVVMLILGLAKQYEFLESRIMPNFLTYLGRASYSIFLIHFPLCLIINAVFFRFLPSQPTIHLFGLTLALGISIMGGILFFRWFENYPITDKMRLWLPIGFLASGALVILVNNAKSI